MISKSISKRHARFTILTPSEKDYFTGGPCEFEVKDLDTKFGTKVNEKVVGQNGDSYKEKDLKIQLGKCPFTINAYWRSMCIQFDNPEMLSQWASNLNLLGTSVFFFFTSYQLSGIPTGLRDSDATTHFVMNRQAGSSITVGTMYAFLKKTVIIDDSYLQYLSTVKESVIEDASLMPDALECFKNIIKNNDQFPSSPEDCINSLEGFSCAMLNTSSESHHLLELLGLRISTFMSLGDIDKELISKTDFVVLNNAVYDSEKISFPEGIFCLTIEQLWKIIIERNSRELISKEIERLKYATASNSTPQKIIQPQRHIQKNIVDDLFSVKKPLPCSPKSKRVKTLENLSIMDFVQPKQMFGKEPEGYLSNQSNNGSAQNKKSGDNSEKTKNSLKSSSKKSANTGSGQGKTKVEYVSYNSVDKGNSSPFKPLELNVVGEKKANAEVDSLPSENVQESEDDKAFEENRRLRNLGSVEYIRIMSSEKSNANSRHTSKYYSGRKNFKKFQKKASQKAPLQAFLSLSEHKKTEVFDQDDTDLEPVPRLMSKVESIPAGASSDKSGKSSISKKSSNSFKELSPKTNNDEDDEFNDLKFHF